MEALLHYVWKHRIFPLKQLHTTGGETLEVIDPGLLNNNAGPDFFNAKVRIDGKIEHIHIAVIVKTNGKAYYSHEVNIKK